MSSPPATVLFVSAVSECGGAELSLLDLVRRLDRGRFRAVAALPGPGSLATALEAAGVPSRVARVCRFRRRAGLAQRVLDLAAWRAGVRDLAEIARAEGALIVHANGDQAQLFGGPAGRAAGSRTIWHCRDLAPLGWLARRMRAQADAAIAISDAVAARLAADLGAAGRVRTIKNGIDTEAFSPAGAGARGLALRSIWGVTGGHVLVGMAAGFAPWKNHELFLAAAAAAARSLPELRFVIAGSDRFGDQPARERELRRAAAARGLDDRLIWAEWVDDMPAFWAACDMAVHPAAREPFGRAVAEAMSMARPVIAIDDAGPGELIESGRSGLLCAAGDGAAMAAAILRLARERDLSARLGGNARQRIVAGFSIESTVEGIQALYDEMAAPA